MTGGGATAVTGRRPSGWIVAVSAVVVLGVVAGAMWALAALGDDDPCDTASAGGLVGYDAVSGEVLWERVVPTGAEVAFVDGVLQVSSSTEGHRAVQRRLDPASGEVESCDVEGSAPLGQGTRPLLDPPVPIGEVTVGRAGAGVEASDDAGQRLWEIATATPLLVARSGLLVDVSEGNDAATALVDVSSGAVVWRHEGRPAVAPAQDRPVVLIDPDEPRAVTARNLATGAVEWTTTLPELVDLDVDVHGTWLGDIVVFNTGAGSRVTAVDAHDGRVRWTGDGGSPGQSPQAPDPGEVDGVLMDPDGAVVVVVVNAYDPEAA